MDEPTTALDVVMQRQILAQLVELRERLGFSVLFITHDLSLLVEFSDRIAIMYGGRIVEEAAGRSTSTGDPLHPYSDGAAALLPAAARPAPGADRHPRLPARPVAWAADARSGTAARSPSTPARRSTPNSSPEHARRRPAPLGRRAFPTTRRPARRRRGAAARSRGTVGALIGLSRGSCGVGSVAPASVSRDPRPRESGGSARTPRARRA